MRGREADPTQPSKAMKQTMLTTVSSPKRKVLQGTSAKARGRGRQQGARGRGFSSSSSAGEPREGERALVDVGQRQGHLGRTLAEVMRTAPRPPITRGHIFECMLFVFRLGKGGEEREGRDRHRSREEAQRGDADDLHGDGQGTRGTGGEGWWQR